MSVYDKSASAYMADVSTPSSCFAIAPRSGYVIAGHSTIYAAITVGNAVITMKIAGTPITGGTITIATSGSAAGTVDECTCTAANYVAKGAHIEFASDGGSTTTAPAMFTAIIR